MTKRVAHYQTLELERVQALARRWKSGHQGTLRILDFGCGRGKYLEVFAAAGFETTGADVNADYIRELTDRGFRVRDAAEVLAGDETYDIVFLSHLVEHVGPDALVGLIPKLCDLIRGQGMLVIVTPLLGERFYYDFSHVRPYYPQSIRHAFGQTVSPLSYGNLDRIELTDIYFFKDPFRTRKLRSFYVGTGLRRAAVDWLNRCFDVLWRISGGRVGVASSWLGVYRVHR
jgi:SAM-dependent methyltransferase